MLIKKKHEVICISELSKQVNIANDNVSIWQQRRNAVGAVWRDAQWTKFERVCNEEIKTLLTKNAKAAEQLDSELTAAINLMNSV
jgi:hypothetical protein